MKRITSSGGRKMNYFAGFLAHWRVSVCGKRGIAKTGTIMARNKDFRVF